MGLQSSAQTVDSPRSANVERYGRYEILRKLATGGMGEVYLARSLGAAGFQKHVVIKRILPHLVEHGHFVEALVREAKILVMLDHPNIVQVLDLGVEGGDYFMAMEFVHGYNLATIAHYCAQKRLLIPAPACVAVGVGVLAGLEYAHALTGPEGDRQNIIHRDVSPQNVMISRDGRVKLTDFGIAKVLNEAEAEFTTSLKGKFRYMAPEAVDGERIDQRYDLFAVGILMFESLCRRHLFGGRSDVDILKQVRAARVPDIARYHEGVAPELVAVTRKALMRDPGERFQNAADFAHALREAIKPVSESESAAQLKAFVGDLYERPDFPISKPKLPNLQDVKLDATRSIVLHSHLGGEAQKADHVGATATAEPTPVVRPSGRLANALVLVVLVLLVAAVGYLVYQQHQPPLPIVVKPRPPTTAVRAKVPAPASEPDLGTMAPDAAQRPDGSTKPRGRRQPKPAITFTPKVGRKYFARHSSRFQRCFDRHATAGAQMTLGVISEIRGSGRVDGVELDPSDQSATPLGKCVIRVARNIRYPRHDTLVVKYKQPLVVRTTQ